MSSTAWLSNMLRVNSASEFAFAPISESTSAACDGTATPRLSLLAGNAGGFGNVDGTGPMARFNRPNGVAVDKSGHLYVADSGNHTIRKITPTGEVTTLAGTRGTRGSADGLGSAASFCQPIDIAVDDAGNLYVADSGNHTIRKITPAGEVTTLAGTAGSVGDTDGCGTQARFHFPIGIAVDHAGNVFVSSRLQHTIRKIDATGLVTTLAGATGMRGNADGIGSAARFASPFGLAVDKAGNVYVADKGNHTIRKVSPDGTVSTLAGVAEVSGSDDGPGAAARLSSPTGIAVDSSGTLYVTEPTNVTIRKITAHGTVETLAGSPTSNENADGIGASAGFHHPTGIAVDGSGNLHVADKHSIRTISQAGKLTTLAGAAPILGHEDGLETARFSGPEGIAVDSSSNVYVADNAGFRIRKILPTGFTTTLTGKTGISDDETSALFFPFPDGVAVDSFGNVYVTNWGDHTIRKTTSAGVTTTLAGLAGTSGSADGAGLAARFYSPAGIAVDGAGNLYVADKGNHALRKITPAGEVATLAGSAGACGNADGAGAAARFNYPTGIAIDNIGNLYVGDSGNHTIRKITPAGVVTTLAGSAGSAGSADGTGTAARFNSPNGIAVDGTGNVYVADRENHTIRKITPAGVVTTVVGQAGIASFVPGALPGLLTAPIGVAIGGGTLYITTNNAVVKVSNVP
jgi:sugar lactone lactonase YvrE